MFFQVTPKASPSERRAGSGSYGTPGVLVLLLQKNCLPRIGANDFKSSAFSKKAAQWCSGDTLHKGSKGKAFNKTCPAGV